MGLIIRACILGGLLARDKVGERAQQWTILEFLELVLFHFTFFMSLKAKQSCQQYFVLPVNQCPLISPTQGISYLLSAQVYKWWSCTRVERIFKSVFSSLLIHARGPQTPPFLWGTDYISKAEFLSLKPNKHIVQHYLVMYFLEFCGSGELLWMQV